MLKVGLVGCGNIGSQLAREMDRRFKREVRLVGLHDANPRRAEQLSKSLSSPVPVCSAQELLARSQLIIEAASPRAVEALLPQILKQRIGLLALSTGGLLARPASLERARRLGNRLLIPSGAVAGIDGLKAASVGKIKSVTLTTRKPPKSLGLASLKKPKVIFSGSAKEAAKAFPQNINVAATLALAGIGGQKTKVQIVADPTVDSNIHEIQVVGSFGRFEVRMQNRPSRNPKTSRLAVQSAIRSLRDLFDSVRVGT